jgi:ATP-dependent Lhr-like helicase
MLRCTRWLVTELALPVAAAEQLAQYLAVSKAALGALPTLRTIVMERFFDEVGDMHLVIHSPYGSRINRAWGLALRKRFCRQFNFELQAAALEDSIVLSLGPSHSFDLDAVKDYLKSATAREVLIQALLDAPMFAARWRWNAGIALAVKRMQGSKRRPPQFQRADSEDLLAVVFPDQLACAENLPGDREIPDHPLVQQTLRDCLHETMDLEGFVRLLERIETGEVNVITRDLTAPSPLAQAILNARPYAFLDDGAAEERRTKAVRADRMLAIEDAVALGGIDPEAVARVQAETSPQPANAEELHDALLINSFLTEAEGRAGGWEQWLDALCRERRAAIVRVSGHETFWIAAERVHEFRAVLPEGEMRPQLPTLAAIPARDEAVREILRSRMELLGPFTTADLARPLSLTEAEVNAALSALEAEGAILRGNYSGSGATEWCERRLLARIHRYARERRHREVQPVSAADFMRFLLHWHPLRRSDADERRLDEAGLLAALRQLEGCLIPAGAWEEDILPARVKDYLPSMLDRLCATGRIAWCRPAPKNGSDDPQRRAGPIRTTPILLCARSNLAHWRGSDAAEIDPEQLGTRARRVYESLRRHGASFFNDLLQETGLLRSEVELALGELAALGIVTCDSFAGLRALLKPVAVRRWRGRQLRAYASLEEAGRWSLSKASRGNGEQPGALADPAVEHIARALLDRYGVVFRRLLDRETGLPPWRDLYYVFRRLEARGEIRGGRFVSGFSGEQFAWPAAAAKLRNVARTDGEEFVAISAADPLNLAGVILPGEKVPALAGNRLLFRNGALIAAQMGGEFRCLQAVRPEAELRQLLIRKPEPLRPYRHKQGSGIGGLGSG